MANEIVINTLNYTNFSQNFLDVKFENCEFQCVAHHSGSDSDYGIDLHELLNEFQRILQAKELTEHKNPRTGNYALIDKSNGDFIGVYDKSMMDVLKPEIVTTMTESDFFEQQSFRR